MSFIIVYFEFGRGWRFVTSKGIKTMDLKLVLKEIWQKWKKLWETISYIITKLLLCIMYYTVFALYGLVAKAMGKDLLDRKMKDNVESYWKEKEKREEETYKQY